MDKWKMVDGWKRYVGFTGSAIKYDVEVEPASGTVRAEFRCHADDVKELTEKMIADIKHVMEAWN